MLKAMIEINIAIIKAGANVDKSLSKVNANK
jgi:hypothetical protein